MKKLINSILGTALAIMVSSVILIGFASCQNNAGKNPGDEPGKQTLNV